MELLRGGRLTAKTNRDRHGDDFYVKIGRKGGSASRGYSFGWGKVDPKVIGKIGGSMPKRRKVI